MEEEQTPDTEQQGQPQCIDDWGTYFLNLAEAAARKSKDPRCQVGAVLVRDNVVLSTGFNGFARGVWDDAALDAGWDRIDARLRAFHAATGKYVVFTELGYDAGPTAASRPWETGAGTEAGQALQQACLRAALRAIDREPVVVGAFLWKWFPS
ncbi:MAG: hypothetical protein ABL879_19580, partial [Devosia sp.]